MEITIEFYNNDESHKCPKCNTKFWEITTSTQSTDEWLVASED